MSPSARAGFVVALLMVGVWVHPAACAEWVVGGQGGMPWSQAAERWIALDDSTRDGAVQLWRVDEEQNVLREKVRFSAFIPRNLFRYKWSIGRGRYAMGVDTLLIGWHPRIWEGGAAEAHGKAELVDGDEFTNAYLLKPPALDRPSPITWITLDLGIPLAVDSLVFFPPQHGFYTGNQRYRDLFPAAYEVSRTNELIDWLLFEDEAASTGSTAYHALPEVIASTYSNNESVVGLSMVPRFTRFIRLRLGGVNSIAALAEIKAYAKGYAQEGRFLSKPHAFDGPVSFGNITWKFTKYRLGADGRIYADPSAPVKLILKTRAGTDADPNAYYIFDELGRQTRVEAPAYWKAFARRGSFEDGLPGFRAALSDDIFNWNAWSMNYQHSGDQNRSSDGRQYLQFDFRITTKDPFAFGVLDSLAFQVSPLLADSVLAEVSVSGSDGRSRLVDVPLGQDTVFVYDMKTVFTGTNASGFDVISLDVPKNTQFLDLEVDGSPAIPGQDFVLTEKDRTLRFGFSKPFTTDTRFRVRYRAALFSSSIFLGGRVENRSAASTYLPQAIESGNVRDDVGSNSTQVVAAAQKLEVLGHVMVEPQIITPNEDGVNDLARLTVPVFGVEEAVIKATVYDLDARTVVRLAGGTVGAGRFVTQWNGRGEEGLRVPPGVYLISVELKVDSGTYTQVRPVAVAY